MVKNNYIPEKGDIVILDFNPQMGHEQMGRRLGLVISNKKFNQFTKLAIVCPITNNTKSFPLHVYLDNSGNTTGAIMCEQIKTVDFVARNVSYYEKLNEKQFTEVMNIIRNFIK